MALLELRSRLTRSLGKFRDETILNVINPNNCLKEITNALLEADFPESMVNEIEKKIHETIIDLNDKSTNKYRPIYQIIYHELSSVLDPGKSALIQEKRDEPSIVMFVGLRGVGKTDTCGKYARYHLKKGFKPALVCADTFSTDAFVRLKKAAKDKIPVYGSYTRDPLEVATEGIEHFSKEKRDLIIIDTNDRHKQFSTLFKEMRQLAKAMKPDLVIYVMDSSIGQASAFDQAQAFKQSFTLGVVIVTNLNGSSKAGGALCAVARAKCPMILAETGEEESNNEFEAFEVESFVKRLLKHDEHGSKILECTYRLRIMYDSHRRELRLDNMPQLNLEKIRRYVTIMGSMTDEELDNPKVVQQISEKRVMEIAERSKVGVSEVMEMIKTYKKKAKRWQKFKVNTNANTPFSKWSWSDV